jgi:hypothetical protein
MHKKDFFLVNKKPFFKTIKTPKSNNYLSEQIMHTYKVWSFCGHNGVFMVH